MNCLREFCRTLIFRGGVIFPITVGPAAAAAASSVSHPRNYIPNTPPQVHEIYAVKLETFTNEDSLGTGIWLLVSGSGL